MDIVLTYIPGDVWICPQNTSRGICLARRDICLFQSGHTHTCSQSYCKKPERRRVVVDGEELLTWFYKSKFPINQVIYEIESRIPSVVAQFS